MKKAKKDSAGALFVCKSSAFPVGRASGQHLGHLVEHDA